MCKNYNSSNRSLVTTLVVLAICLVIVTGSTFSLFTSKTGVNIAVTAGNVEFEATINNALILYSMDKVQEGTFENGGTAELTNNNQTLTLTNITPGDKVELTIDLNNKSNVKTAYRVLWSYGENDTLTDLEVSIKNADNSYDEVTTGTSQWYYLDANAAAASTTLVIELPVDSEQETKVANISFAVEAVQANGTGLWKSDAYVNDAEGLQAAINAGATEIILNEDVTLTDTLVIPAAPATYSLRNAVTPIVIDLNGNTLSTVDKNVVRNDGSPLVIKNGTISRSGTAGGYAINNVSGALSIEELTVVGGVYTSGAELTVTNCNVSQYLSGRHGIYAYNCIVTLANSNVHNDNAGNSTIMAAGSSVVTINGGEFSIANGQATHGWTSCMLDSQHTASIVINDGIFNGAFRTQAGSSLTINGGSFNDVHSSGYSVYTGGVVTVNGGIFTGNNAINYAKKYVAEGKLVIDNGDNTYAVYANTADTKITLKSGAVLDLGGVEFLGSIVAEGDLTIKGDAKFKSLSATNGGTITVEKTLTLNNFSFGNVATAGAEYTITGGTITANYGFFQHGVYDLYSNFETGYMYYSFGSDITVYGTFHSQGKGDGLDYVRGKLTIAKGGKSIHDKSLWVGQPASWGAMNATLIVEEGGYVQANSLSVYEGSALYNDAANIGVEGVGVKYNKLTGNVSYCASNVEGLLAAVNLGGEVTLVNDITATEIIFLEKSITINGNGYKVISPATRVFRVTNSNVEVALNDVNMVSNAVRVSSNDIRGISIDASLTNVKLTLNNCSVDFTDSSAHDWAYAVNVSGSGTGHTVIVNGGSYEGANVINANGAKNTIVVKNATLTSLYLPSVYENMYGACIYVAQDANSSIEATGNTFNGDNAVAINAGITPCTENNNTNNTKRA